MYTLTITILLHIIKYMYLYLCDIAITISSSSLSCSAYYLIISTHILDALVCILSDKDKTHHLHPIVLNLQIQPSHTPSEAQKHHIPN